MHALPSLRTMVVRKESSFKLDALHAQQAPASAKQPHMYPLPPDSARNSPERAGEPCAVDLHRPLAVADDEALFRRVRHGWLHVPGGGFGVREKNLLLEYVGRCGKVGYKLSSNAPCNERGLLA